MSNDDPNVNGNSGEQPISINDNGYLADRLSEAFMQFTMRLDEQGWRVAARTPLNNEFFLVWHKRDDRWGLWIAPKAEGAKAPPAEISKASKALKVLAAKKLPDLMQAIKDAQAHEAKAINDAIRLVNEVTGTLGGSQ